MNIFDRILLIGVSDTNEGFINQKIKITNGIAAFFISILVLNVGIIGFWIPEMFYMVLICAPIYLSVFYLNHWSYNTISRYLVAFTASGICYLLHNMMIKEGEPGMSTFYMIQGSMLVLPWILFDYREKGNLVFAFLTTAAFIFLVEPTNSLFDAPASFDLTMMKSDNMQITSRVSVVIIMGVLLFILQKFNMESETRNLKLLEDAALKSKQMLEGEEKMNIYVKEVEEAREEDKKREWTSKGLALFAEILRSTSQNNDNIYDKIISNIVKYLRANQGALFVVEKLDEKDVIAMKSCYAYDRKKYIDQVIYPGEGMIGQCYFEKEFIYLKDVPENFVKITSGTGAALPKEIIMVPLLLNEKVFGVLELASFDKFETYQIDFLKKVGESLASSISSFKNTEETKIILEQSMQQAEELRSQEEEMRQTLEEMNAIQEEMAKKQQAMEETISELIDKNKVLEERDRQNVFELSQALQELDHLKSA